VFLALLAGCASSPDDAPPPRPVRFAALVAPRLGPDPDRPPERPTAEDVLLEAVTTLSLESDLGFALVAGPLVTGDDPATLAIDRDAVAGALGSIAARVYVALTPDEATSPDLLEALARGVQKHPGDAAYTGPPVAGWRPVALGPAGEVPPSGVAEDADGGALPTAAVYAGTAPLAGEVGTLVVRAGPAPRLAVEDGRVVLELPPLHQPPHVYAIVTVSPDGEVSAALHTALGEPGPPALAPVRLDVP
jgi:hypothetical protein